MTLKTKQSAVEHTFSIYRSKISSSLLEEIEQFKKRNCIIVGFDSKLAGIKCVCCEQCLKAYILSKVKDFGADGQIGDIGSLFKCETGHDGYYLDEEKLSRTLG